MNIHSEIGPGLIESVYETVLCSELTQRGLSIVRQKRISFMIHHKQLLTYLRLLDHRLGLVLNFGAPLMKDGIHRVVNKM